MEKFLEIVKHTPEEKQLQLLADVLYIEKRDYETNVLMKSKIAEKIKIPPDKLFLNDRAYSEFDDNGFPIKDHNGQVLTKSKIKRLKKLLIQHKKRHLKWKEKK